MRSATTASAMPDTSKQDVDEARARHGRRSRGRHFARCVTDELVDEGVQQFADAFDKLLRRGRAKRRAPARAASCNGHGSAPADAHDSGDTQAELETWRKEGTSGGCGRGDKTLWTGADEDKWLGWLAHRGAGAGRHAARCSASPLGASATGFTDVVLLGMGGSSLGAEVLSETFGAQPGWPRLHVLDSTDPAQIRRVENAIDIARPCSSSPRKSGSTLEPNIFMALFLRPERKARARTRRRAFRRHHRSWLGAGEARERKASRTSSTASQRSADAIRCCRNSGWSRRRRWAWTLRGFLDGDAAVGARLRRLVPPAENPGVQLGIALGVAAKQFGRDKITIVASPGIADLGAWLEQLIAESTGKQGKG